MRGFNNTFCAAVVTTMLLPILGSTAFADPLPKPGVPVLPSMKLIPRTATSVPISTVVFDAPHPLNTVPLDKYGYVEEEYFVSGTANVYSEPKHDTVTAANVPYTTRILVRRPASAAKFSGTIHLEPIRDLTEWYTTWLKSWPYFVRNGDVWIGFTMAKENVTNYLQKYSPERYRDIHIEDNGQRWDIMSQVAALARSAGGPLGRVGFIERAKQVPAGLKLYSSGWSLTGCMQVTFINAGHHARARTESGGPIIDGYLPGICPRGAHIDLPADAPVIEVMSENEYADVFFDKGYEVTAAARQPDRDGARERFRWYDLAGTSHIDPIDLPDLSVVWTQLNMQSGLHTECGSPISKVANKEDFVPAILALLDRWARTGNAPPASRLFELNADKSIARDTLGNAKGGVRGFWMDAPSGTVGTSTEETAANKAHPQAPPLGGICKFLTHIEPLPHDVESKLYPTRAAYRAKADSVINALVSVGLLLPEEAKKQAAHLN
jgi:hypothetical protein